MCQLVASNGQPSSDLILKTYWRAALSARPVLLYRPDPMTNKLPPLPTADDLGNLALVCAACVVLLMFFGWSPAATDLMWPWVLSKDRDNGGPDATPEER